MRAHLLLLVLAAQFFAARPAPRASDEFDLIINHQRNLLLAKPPATPPATIDRWVQTLTPAGPSPTSTIRTSKRRAGRRATT